MTVKFICKDCKYSFSVGNFNKQEGRCMRCSIAHAALAAMNKEQQDRLNAMADDVVVGGNREKKQAVDTPDIKK